MFTFITPVNYIHCINHKLDSELTSVDKIIRSVGIFQTRQEHSIHHKNDHDLHCIIGSYLNPILDYIRFWYTLEQIIYSVSGIQPIKENDKNYSNWIVKY